MTGWPGTNGFAATKTGVVSSAAATTRPPSTTASSTSSTPTSSRQSFQEGRCSRVAWGVGRSGTSGPHWIACELKQTQEYHA